MPIYEYRCASCGHEFEAMQKFSEAVLTECPSCGKAALQKLVSAAGFQLKGSGWYATDFKGGSGKAAKAATSETGGKSEGETPSAAPKKHDCGSGGCGSH